MNILPRIAELAIRNVRPQLKWCCLLSTAATTKPRFQDQTAIVTASTDGIGYGIAKRLAEEGAYVIISSRKQANVDKALKQLHDQGLTNVSGVVCDVISKNDRASLLKHTLEKRPGVDILVSVAGKALLKPLIQVDESAWEYIMNINVKSHFFLTQEVLPHIISRGKGTVLYLSSASGFLPVPTRGIYPMTKAAIHLMTQMMASELAPHNIRVNCIAPGLIDTPLARPVIKDSDALERYYGRTLIKRVGRPEEIGSVAAFLASDDASYITGEILVVAGGLHCRI